MKKIKCHNTQSIITVVHILHHPQGESEILEFPGALGNPSAPPMETPSLGESEILEFFGDLNPSAPPNKTPPSKETPLPGYQLVMTGDIERVSTSGYDWYNKDGWRDRTTTESEHTLEEQEEVTTNKDHYRFDLISDLKILKYHLHELDHNLLIP